MDRTQVCRIELDNMMDYFHRRLAPRIIEMYINLMMRYKSHVIQKAVANQIQDGERFPRLKELRIVLDHYGATTREIQYDPVEDFRYPIENLKEAFYILMRGGHDAFLIYANKTHMPANDRDRVKMKAAVVSKGKDFAGALKGLSDKCGTQ